MEGKTGEEKKGERKIGGVRQEGREKGMSDPFAPISIVNKVSFFFHFCEFLVFSSFSDLCFFSNLFL